MSLLASARLPTHVTVTIVAGRKLTPKKPGACNPFVTVQLGRTEFHTRVAGDNQNPVWDETFLLPINDWSSELVISVYHNVGGLRKDSLIGQVRLDPNRLSQEPPQARFYRLGPRAGKTERPGRAPRGELSAMIGLHTEGLSTTHSPHTRTRAPTAAGAMAAAAAAVESTAAAARISDKGSNGRLLGEKSDKGASQPAGGPASGGAGGGIASQRAVVDGAAGKEREKRTDEGAATATASRAGATDPATRADGADPGRRPMARRPERADDTDSDRRAPSRAALKPGPGGSGGGASGSGGGRGVRVGGSEDGDVEDDFDEHEPANRFGGRRSAIPPHHARNHDGAVAKRVDPSLLKLGDEAHLEELTHADLIAFARRQARHIHSLEDRLASMQEFLDSTVSRFQAEVDRTCRY